MITKDSIESAYSFFHQKYRVYQYSTLDWQKDDIEYAIGSYVADMNKDLYALLANGNDSYLLDHTCFDADLSSAVERLEEMLE
ncbi:hypothetical protein HMPREF3034_02663 [Prevotella sp. DNF00663]|uniref:hypothetical protein n=1 Tax=unclassified Prevotella TaxID=2638335 RepID=UPI000514035A|nr:MULTISPECIES: hypothetical protein [unclassified Prevotella]KGI59466.1 hypothetical protein HMPREF0671_11515 [Prevotella sp. S7 MS 2]KXB77739.1 hypothetical protein HMPREF3034_02663 [Prevotella sp. DNF00663]